MVMIDESKIAIIVQISVKYTNAGVIGLLLKLDIWNIERAAL